MFHEFVGLIRISKIRVISLPCLNIPDHPYRILIIGSSGSGKTNALLNLINNPYLIKDMHEGKYQYLIKKHKKVILKHYNGFKVFLAFKLYAR